MADQTSTPQSPEAGNTPEVGEIAKWVLALSGLVIIALSAVVLVGAWGTDDFQTASQLVFNSLLPLLGTWVGTVLAYYFSRKNFESASQSVERMVTLTTEQKLAQILVEKEMLRPDQITAYRIPAGKTPADVPLKDLRSKLGGRITRIPILDDRGAILYIVHQSGLFKFVADSALAGKTPADIEMLTLQDLVNDAELKNWAANIVFVPEGTSVGEAKTAMEAQRGCQDLIVTRSGGRTEPMLGWMTNVDIGRLSRA